MCLEKERCCRMRYRGTRKILFAFCWKTGLSIWLWFRLPILRFSSYHFRVDPTATSDDKQDTPLEIALGCHQHLEVLHILAKFMEVPDNVKHIQLAVLVNRNEAEEGENEEFHKILHSMPVDLVGFLIILIDICLIRSAPKSLNKADVEQFSKMLYKWAKQTLFDFCWNSGGIFWPIDVTFLSGSIPLLSAKKREILRWISQYLLNLRIVQIYGRFWASSQRCPSTSSCSICQH